MDVRTQSYLIARDSIVTYSRSDLNKVKIDFASSNSLESGENEEIDTCVTVYLRIRGDAEQCDLYEVEDRNLICKVSDEKKKTYSFTSILGPDVQQSDIFNSIVKPKLLAFINGRNSTLFTFGASGSGKTFTIVGTPDAPGLIPRALEYIFRSISKVQDVPEVKPLPNGYPRQITERDLNELYQKLTSIKNASLTDQSAHMKTYMEIQQRLSLEPRAEISDDKDVSVSVWLSFSEIYNEIIYDLLVPPVAKGKQRQKLALGKTKDENTYIKDLTLLNVSNGLEAYQVLQYGLHNLNYAATNVNSHSSRSHCIFTIKLVQSSKTSSAIYVSNFSFCDLAGSERLKKTMNIGDRLKESNNINTSLLVLGRCIDNIRKCQHIKDRRLIPFRDSKLTQIFQRALMGYERVAMIVNINPTKSMFDETIHALNFSAIAKTIIIEEKKPQVYRKKSRFTMLIEEEDALANKDKKEKQIPRLVIESEDQNKNDTELEKLHQKYDHLMDAFDRLLEERDSIVEYYQNKMKKEKEFISELYMERIETNRKRFAEEKAQALKRQKIEYESKLAEKEVINISSDDSDSDCESPVKKQIIDNSPQNQKLREEIEALKGQLESVLTKNRKLKDRLEDSDALIKENEELNQRLLDLEDLLRDAKVQYRLLQAENESLLSKLEKLTEMNEIDSEGKVRIQENGNSLLDTRITENEIQIEESGVSVLDENNLESQIQSQEGCESLLDKSNMESQD